MPNSQNTYEQLPLKMDFFLGIFKKLQKVFKSTHEQMFHAVYIVQTAILKGSSHQYFNSRKINFSKKGETHKLH